MTATYAHYIVAYPHPAIPPRERIQRLKVDTESSGERIVAELRGNYLEHSDDLKNPILRKATDIPYKPIVDDSLEQVHNWIHIGSPDDRIELFEALALHFPEGPHDPSKRLVDIVVVTPEISEYIDLKGDPDGNLRHMKARKTLVTAMKKTSSPSESIKSPSTIKNAVDASTGPRYGRPAERFGPPAVLFNQALALLSYDLEHLETFTPNAVIASYASDFISNTTTFFRNDGEKEASLRSTLEKLLIGTAEWQRGLEGGTAKPGGVWHEDLFAYLIVGIKNEPGLGGDPFLQSLIVYNKILAQQLYAPFYGRSNFPVVLLALAGNRLVISVAIFTDSVYVDELLSMTLRAGFHASDRVLHVARVFMAINMCTQRLRKLYRVLLTTSRSVPSAKVLWPNPTVHPSQPVGLDPSLQFISKVDRLFGTKLQVVDGANKQHAIYLAKMRIPGDTSTREVLVKFTAKYNEDAHRLLAENDPPLAPTLHSCTCVIGDLFMVVMQYISESEGGCLRDVSLRPNLEAVRAGVSEALRLLHGRDLVFGDLREGNLLYLPNDGGRVLFVDFDRVGKHKVDRYSACLNREAGLAVDSLELMEKSHDVENFDRLMSRLSEWQ